MERLTVRVTEGNRKDECFIPGNKNAIEKVEYICEDGRWESEEYKGKAVDKLAEYETLEEQGKLLKLPCAVGDTVYTIHNVKRKEQISKEIWENVVTSFNVERDCDWNISFEHVEPSGLIFPNYCEFKHIGKYVFLTKTDATRALKEMEGKNVN